MHKSCSLRPDNAFSPLTAKEENLNGRTQKESAALPAAARYVHEKPESSFRPVKLSRR